MISAAVKTLILISKFLPINNTNYVSYIRQRFGPITSKQTFGYVKLLIKQAKLKKDLEFLRTCKQSQLAPTFVRIQIPITHQHYKRAIHSFRMQLLNDEIRIKKRNLTKNYKLVNNIKSLLKETITDLTWLKLTSIFRQIIQDKKRKWTQTHERKLDTLREQSNTNRSSNTTNQPPNKYIRSTNTTGLPSKPIVITNLSSRKLTEEETRILDQGLDHVFPPTKFDDCTFIANIENYFVNLLGHATDKRDYETKGENEQTVYQLTPDQLKCASKLRQTCNSFKNSAKRSLKDQQQDTLRIKKVLTHLSKDPSIVITRPDKGRGVVILNKSDYVRRMNEILSDSSTFQQIKEDETIKQENRLNRKLSELKNSGFITEEDYKYAKARGSLPARLYGLPKIHKPRDTEGLTPFRPIVSSSNTFNYRLAKLLTFKLNHIRQSNNIIRDTFTFVEWLHKLDIDPNDYEMLSFDITSLFTKVPLDQTIKIILDKIYGTPHTCIHSKNRKSTWCQICRNRHEMKTLLEMATKESHFSFDGKIFCQRNGIAMGSPMGPLLADVYVSYLEEKFMKRIRTAGVEHYKRFVDDTFTLVRKGTDKSTILNILNSYDIDIQFTCEEETNRHISFLDVNVERAPSQSLTNKPFITTVYRKKTFTGLLLKWSSYTPRSYKVSAISSMVYRATKICSTFLSLTDELDTVRDLAWKNGYPDNFVEAQIRNTMNRYYEKKNDTTSSKTSNSIQTNKNQQVYVDIPYFGNITDRLGKKLINIAKTVRPQLNVQPIPRPPASVASSFSTKDKIPLLLNSNIVYQVSCQQCPATYVGKTLRQLDRRLIEHGKPAKKKVSQPTSPSRSSTLSLEDTRRSKRTAKPTDRLGIPSLPTTLCPDTTTHQPTMPPPQSALLKHATELQHNINWLHVKILDKDNHPYRLLIRESLAIQRLEPPLNRTVNSIPLLVYPEGLARNKPNGKIKDQYSDNSHCHRTGIGDE